MSEATFTIFPTPELQWGVRRETNGCGFVADATWEEPLGALLHASSRAGEYFPCKVVIPREYLPAVLESLNDQNYDAWLADGQLTCGSQWDGDYSDVLADDMRDDYIGAD
jgi:hypothetical protein